MSQPIKASAMAVLMAATTTATIVASLTFTEVAVFDSVVELAPLESRNGPTDVSMMMAPTSNGGRGLWVLVLQMLAAYGQH
ncbi:hypothetical protein B0T10DRAFT_473492 [Thelonectria olida]|uniref:Uncharacterized protein n=1 Tax=Thelonectria olida TaxID=1576542 RepID=A0A9P8WJY3_9HYPO|nr:hypothetical protein B0T10DRAFT_473492 [Thelonectria olida]